MIASSMLCSLGFSRPGTGRLHTYPILIDETGTILAGHGRVEAAKSLNLAEVPCLRIETMSPAEKRAYVIADNKLALNAGWDEELLASELQG